MDQNDVSMQPTASSGYQYMPDVTAYNPTGHVNIDSGNEYTPNVPAYSPQMVNYQYSGDIIPTYSNTETIDPSMTSECNVMPNNYEYVPNYLTPANFYGNTSYTSSQYQKVEDNYGYGNYGQDITTQASVYSNPNDVPLYSEPAQQTVLETKPMVVDEICVEEAKIEIKTDEPQPMEESQSIPQQEVVVEHPTVTVHHDEEPRREEKSEPREPDRVEMKQEIQDFCDAKATQNVVNTEGPNIADENAKQDIANGNMPAETVIQSIQMCIRSGCANEAVNNPEWEQEFCSNECVILHCKNVFTTWVQSNQVATH